MKYLFLLFILLSVTQGNSQNPKTNFDFWVGNWTVSWDEAGGTKGHGTNKICNILNSTAIQENFIINKGVSKGFVDTSISSFITETKEWKQTWMDNSGGYYDFTGITENGNPVFITDIEEKDDRKIIRKMTFNDITENSLTWDWEGSQDGGKTWELLWGIYHFRTYDLGCRT